MSYHFHHVQVTVANIAESEIFYDQLFSFLGYDLKKKYKGYLEHANMHVVEYLGDGFDFGICSPAAAFQNEEIHPRKPGAIQHIAFKADSRAEVDEIFNKISHLDVKILHGKPKEYTERIAPNYYALFFEAPDGIRFEIFHYPNE
ncbi:VOC family protein [Enterococcus sp. LJL51]|uniref:VOC family protein n=1 Tax=Enterococcus sp. LJL51 TaxID=3416656 RepID=UPI003CEE60FB